MAGDVSRACKDDVRPAKGLLLRLRRFIADRRGVGAIEFAIVAPMLIITYIGAFEISVAISMARKVSRASSTVSDLLTRNESTTAAVLASMKDVTSNVITPFKQDGYTLMITGIAIDAAGSAKVAWSRDQDGGTPYTKGSTVILPPDVAVKDAFIVRTEYTVPHKILLMAPGLSSHINNITLGKTSYFRKRTGETIITCSDC
ncbi:TadE/TadG family type IV pilus assembly protein [Shinella oryzae]|uniref:TadE/TadG family type IV pilus assembly protein n=1 Tax=Shinella oryzae TaxID=2871820 RepID=UPI001FF4C809|nr:TadE/TadG family type IV pilus assembly protein [Shinella oryzae]UPA24535.1 pilus assembly protein [Shinella oryzae]